MLYVIYVVVALMIFAVFMTLYADGVFSFLDGLVMSKEKRDALRQAQVGVRKKGETREYKKRKTKSNKNGRINGQHSEKK